MTPPSIALPTDPELTEYISALKNDEQHVPRWPIYRGGPGLDPMTEDEYRFSPYGQADYDGHIGGGA
ncbi:hypothetical protein ABZ470_26540 [Streptosporangium sp. NPDC020072]|uniref:hypothetical protein n=1 Tax=Streptosporangium sp. NPDC020072 TaxID=3154788 RepID=UPI00342451AA